MSEDGPSLRQDVAAAECSRDVSEVDDVSCVAETANHPRTQTATDNTSVDTVPPRSTRLTKFIDRRTETLISACATVSTTAADDAVVPRDVISTRENGRQVTSPVLRSTNHRDQKLVSSPRDCTQLGGVDDVAVHRSTLTTVPTTKTTTTSVSAARAPASLIVLRSERPQAETTAAAAGTRGGTDVAVVSPCSAESRLTVTLAETVRQPSQRSCRLITRAPAASTKPRDVAGSGSEIVNHVVSSRPTDVQSPLLLFQSCLRSLSSSERSVAEGDAEKATSRRRPTSTCVLAQLSPITVQPRGGQGRSMLATDGRVLTPSSMSTAAAADATSTATTTTSRRPVVDFVPLPPPPSTVGATLTTPSLAVTSSRQPATAASPSRYELRPAAETPATKGASTMTALDDALAMLTSVVTEDCQPHSVSTAEPDVRHQNQTTSPCPGQSRSQLHIAQHCAINPL